MNKNFAALIILYSGIILFTLSACNSNRISSDVIENPNTASGKGDLSQLPSFKFEAESHDFGKIVQGETVSFPFKFRNTGKSDLVISDVSTSCGCTVPSFPKAPVHPGQDGIIRVTFNSAGKRGFQNKNIVVVANTQPNTFVLRIKAEVSMAGSQK
ncbi:MAG: DUF1573 domain-containing protein [Bacteroidetes bacterium]|nr:DUF1573 domain-containing protein [Bacteroidota bacterium]